MSYVEIFAVFLSKSDEAQSILVDQYCPPFANKNRLGIFVKPLDKIGDFWNAAPVIG